MKPIVVSTAKQPDVSLRNPYSVRYEVLRKSIIAAATDTWDALDGAAIELVSGLFTLFEDTKTGYPEVWNGYQALRHLHDFTVLDEASEWFSLPSMRRHDVVLGLALHKNEVANFLLGEAIADNGWEQADARALGLRAAVSATECHAWAIALKQECRELHVPRPDETTCRESEVPRCWKFRPGYKGRRAAWRRPSVVWVLREFLTTNSPMPRLMEPGSRQLEALTAATKYSMTIRLESSPVALH